LVHGFQDGWASNSRTANANNSNGNHRVGEVAKGHAKFSEVAMCGKASKSWQKSGLNCLEKKKWNASK